MRSLTSHPVLGLLAALLFTISLSPDLLGQRLKPGPQDLTFFSTGDETNQPYSIYIPNHFDEEKEYPLVIFLHGAMSNNRLGLRRVFGLGNIQGPEFVVPGHVPAEDDLEATRYWPDIPDCDFIVAAPFARGTAMYKGIAEQDVFDMLADIKSRFNIDEDRMYLTGLSMGGMGTLNLSITRPDLWAAIAPVCAGVPAENTDKIANLSNLPAHIFVGSLDRPEGKRELRDNLLAVGSPVVEYTEYPGIGHNSWEYAYKDGFIFQWFSQFERNLYPERVQFGASKFKYNKAYWVTLDNLTPGTLATIDARFTGTNALEIRSKDLLAFTLNLKGHPLFDPSKKVSITIDGKNFSLKSPENFAFSREKESWTNRKFTPELMSKQNGAEGPMYEAVSSNHVYVYGTADNPTPEELASRRAQAMEAATWALNRGFYQGTITIFPRVVADNNVRQSDLDLSNLVLFGTRETNAVIAKYADRLPLHLNADARDHGLVYIFPMNKRYVLVSSGLPWWTSPPPEPGQGPMSFFANTSKAESLSTTEDFLLFRETNDKVVASGKFDNLWKLPAGAAEKLKASQVVTMK
ncbi:MAG: alpha/beta hydrolase-fold protein [Bacteroidales bacterium]